MVHSQLQCWLKLPEKKRFVPPPTLSSFWQFSPHLLHSLQHHVAVTVESLHPAQQLLVVPEIFHAKISKTAHCVYLQLIKTWVLFLTESVRTLRGPVENSSCCNIVINCDHCCGIWIIIIMLSFSSFITLSCITTLLLHLLLRLTLFGCHVCLTGHPDHQFYISETKFNGKLLRPLRHDSSAAVFFHDRIFAVCMCAVPSFHFPLMSSPTTISQMVYQENAYCEMISGFRNIFHKWRYVF